MLRAIRQARGKKQLQRQLYSVKLILILDFHLIYTLFLDIALVVTLCSSVAGTVDKLSPGFKSSLKSLLFKILKIAGC